MKFFLPFLFFIICLYFVWYFFYFKDEETNYKNTYQIKKTNIKEENNFLKVIKVNENKYRYKIYKVKNINNLILQANFFEKSEAEELYKKNKCSFLTNGSYYDEKDKPLGYLKTSEGEIYKNAIESRLIDGFLFMDEEGNTRIDFNLDENKWGIQAGPLLIFDGNILSLKINNDEKARRVFAAVDKNNNLYFSVVVFEESEILGPNLADLPEIALNVGKKENIAFLSAINLDGGSASVFMDGQTKLKERNYIGSWFCER